MLRRTALSTLAGMLAIPRISQSEEPANAPPGGQTKQAGQEFTISTTSRLVILDVSVKAPKGNSVAGLRQENFEVFENGKLQKITQFANADIPVTVGILVDESGSMAPKRNDVITAALAFIGGSNPQDEVFIINFNEKAYRGLPETLLFSDDINQLRDALWKQRPEGRTALYEAILKGLKQLSMGRRDKRTLVLISDGGDNISTHKLEDVLDGVMDSFATIYTIGIFDEDDPDRNPGVLKKLAHLSGGVAYFPAKLEEVAPICRQIAKEVRTRYTIGYVPAVDNGTGVRHLQVKATAPEGGKLIATTRTGYLFKEGI
jgi:Ca-activated chloride channel homolog